MKPCFRSEDEFMCIDVVFQRHMYSENEDLLPPAMQSNTNTHGQTSVSVLSVLYRIDILLSNLKVKTSEMV